MSISQNIDAMFFAADAPLRDEFDYLYASIFHRPESYIAIVTALGKKKAGMCRNEIVTAGGLREGGELTKYLEELEKCDFIRSYTSFGKKKKDTVYQLIDNFTLFYFKFLTDRTRDEHYWSNMEMSSKKDDEKLQRQLSDFRAGTNTRYALHPTLVTVYGLKDGSYSGSIQAVITAEDLFQKE